MRNVCLGLLSAGILAGCAPVGETPPRPATDCPVSDSRNWHAWVDRMPGPGSKATLNISGEVDLPTPGYSVSLRAGPADRAMPPGQRFALEATPPDGMVAQVVTPTEVRYRAPADYPHYREIIVGCGSTTLVTIPDVMIAE
ncbi:hypothetical protein V5F89_12855 [Pelagerythrobacter marensis]|uniref:Lipoprotein n=1 Tax=Pelagerythrobacter marensis TaxID=543877 RepID=A0ABZ2D292_9SPHN